MHPILTTDSKKTLAKIAAATASLPAEDRLKTSKPNAKTKALLSWVKEHKGIDVKPSEFLSVSLLSGISCPGANLCKSQAVDLGNGKRTIQDAPSCKFRCFAANDEAQYNETYAQRKHNRDLILKYKDDPYALAALILASIPGKVRLVRFHIGGDFFCLNYLLAVVIAAKVRPSMRIYFYTKSLHFVAKLDCNAADLPDNLSPVMSEGGLFDPMLPDLKARGFRTARVVMDPADAGDLEVDHKDNLAAYGDRDFTILIHGTQPKGSDAGKAVYNLRKAGVKVGYKRKGTKQTEAVAK